MTWVAAYVRSARDSDQPKIADSRRPTARNGHVMTATIASRRSEIMGRPYPAGRLRNHRVRLGPLSDSNATSGGSVPRVVAPSTGEALFSATPAGPTALRDAAGAACASGFQMS